MPVWRRQDLNDSQLIAEFQREARVIRKGVSGDLIKVRTLCALVTSRAAQECLTSDVWTHSAQWSIPQTIRDGKPIIIEGTHIDPGLYLYEFGHHGICHLQERGQRMSSGAAAAAPVQPYVLATASPRYGTDLPAVAVLHMENVFCQAGFTPVERHQGQDQKSFGSFIPVPEANSPGPRSKCSRLRC